MLRKDHLAALLVVCITGAGAAAMLQPPSVLDPLRAQASVGNSAGSLPGVGLDRFYAQKLNWKDCTGQSDLKCATFLAPVDYAQPDGATVEIAMAKSPAWDTAKGAILVNPGGPGGSGIDYAEASLFTDDILTDRDIIGWDPRGVGQSTLLDCLDPSEVTDYEFRPINLTDPEEFTEYASITAEAVSTCASNPDHGHLSQHMSSLDNARDMELIRHLIGADKLDYYGVSYGTVFGTAYLQLFPDKAGKFVLDSALSPTMTGADYATGGAKGLTSATDAFLSDCVKRGKCPLGATKAEALGNLTTLVNEATESPLYSATGEHRFFSGYTVLSVIERNLYSTYSWPRLAKALGEAKNSDKVDGLAKLADASFSDRRRVSHADPPVDDNSDEIYMATVCADFPLDEPPSEVQALSDQNAKTYPLWGRYTATRAFDCRGWTGAQWTYTLPIGQASGPVLVLANAHDPSTPIDWSRQLAKDLANAKLIETPLSGHGAYFAGNECVDLAVDRYLLGTATPKTDQVCPADPVN